MQFIEYRPAIALVHADGSHSAIRRAEDLGVMNAQDVLPGHLRSPVAGSQTRFVREHALAAAE